jgi:DnaK suppressor protein
MDVVKEARVRLAVDRDETARRLANLTGNYESVVAASRDTNADDEHVWRRRVLRMMR